MWILCLKKIGICWILGWAGTPASNRRGHTLWDMVCRMGNPVSHKLGGIWTFEVFTTGNWVPPVSVVPLYLEFNRDTICSLSTLTDPMPLPLPCIFSPQLRGRIRLMGNWINKIKRTNNKGKLLVQHTSVVYCVSSTSEVIAQS